MKIRCMIVDDEPLAQKVIEKHLSKVPNMTLVKSCFNAVEAFEVLLKEKIDLIFLDIEMPEITGVDLLKSLKNGPHVIFTTAHRDFAIDAFELDAVDYLLKPVSFERFFKAITRFFQLRGHDNSEVIGQTKISEDAFLYVRADRKVMKIILAEIRYIESLKDYVKIHVADEIIITKEKIGTLEERLPSDQFIRTHRSFIIASRFIRSFTSETIDINDYEIPIGRTYKTSVLSFLKYRE